MVNKLVIRKPALWLPREHHSVGDWDLNPATYDIASDFYISSPTSIRWNSAGTAYMRSLCRNAATIHLPEGSIVNNFRFGSTSRYGGFEFRNTAPLGTANEDNCYYLLWRGFDTHWHFYERGGGVNIRSWQKNKHADVVNVWTKYRLSWWMAWELLQVRLEYWNGSIWVIEGEDVGVANPLYGEEELQRPGLYGHGALPPAGMWWDDTEIWEKE